LELEISYRFARSLTPSFLLSAIILAFFYAHFARSAELKMANSQHEPTMEEILASIRKIISDDASAASAPQATPAVSPPEHTGTEPEVLDLTHEVGETAASTVNATATPVEKPDEAHPTPAIEASPEPVPVAEAISLTDDGFFSERTRQALSDALAGIGTEPETESHVEIPSETHADVTGVTVEAVFERAVKDAFEPVFQKWLAENNEALIERMKPAIRDWLDENFPALLEDAIRSELARIKPRVRR
jgi:hypothetical protein